MLSRDGRIMGRKVPWRIRSCDRASSTCPSVTSSQSPACMRVVVGVDHLRSGDVVLDGQTELLAVRRLAPSTMSMRWKRDIAPDPLSASCTSMVSVSGARRYSRPLLAVPQFHHHHGLRIRSHRSPAARGRAEPGVQGAAPRVEATVRIANKGQRSAPHSNWCHHPWRPFVVLHRGALKPAIRKANHLSLVHLTVTVSVIDTVTGRLEDKNRNNRPESLACPKHATQKGPAGCLSACVRSTERPISALLFGLSREPVRGRHRLLGRQLDSRVDRHVAALAVTCHFDAA